MSKILLIVPTHNYNRAYPHFTSVSDFPTGYAYIASALKEAGHEVIGLNLNNITGYDSAHEMITDKITLALQDKPDLIALGGICVDYRFLKDAIEIINRANSRVPIVLGGGIVTHDAEFIFNLLEPWFCIIGEGEEVIVELANMRDSGKENYGKIPNLGYWEKGKAIFTKQNFNYPDINKRPFPDYEPFDVNDMLDNYSLATRILYSYSRLDARPMVITTARGCPFNCTFCVHQGGPKYRARSIENVMEEIALMYERYKFNILLIVDELFAVNKQRMKDFCHAIIEAKKIYGWDFDFQFQTHPSADFDLETLKLAKEAGCYFFSYGLESASPTVLKSMNKKSKPSQIKKAIELANSVGVGFAGNLLFGDPAETEKTIRETMEFFFQYCLKNFIFVTTVEPYPGSKIFDDCLESGMINSKFEYYENIDLQKIYNMTSMPTGLFTLWMKFLQDLSGTNLWIKSTKATHYEEEPVNNPITEYAGRKVWRVWARCPYCGEDIYYREMLSGTKNLPPITTFGPGCTKCNKWIKIYIEVK